MLDKTKVWCHRVKEKSRTWIQKHKFALGASVGAVATVGVGLILAKIGEPVSSYVELRKESTDDGVFSIRTVGTNRFGNDCMASPSFEVNDKVRDVLFSSLKQFDGEYKAIF